MNTPEHPAENSGSLVWGIGKLIGPVPRVPRAGRELSEGNSQTRTVVLDGVTLLPSSSNAQEEGRQEGPQL